MGSGRQFVSWIHGHDLTNALLWIIDHPELSGPVNVCSPNPVPNAEFMRTLRNSLGIRWGLPASEWMLELGALFLQTETELILKSRRVVPHRLLASGFEFQFPQWFEAAAQLATA
jgi:uncharacterized protein